MDGCIEFFRFTDMREDVFIEGDHYLYASARPCRQPYLFACNEYRVKQADNGKSFERGSTVAASAEYLETLQPAPVEEAAHIIKAEGTLEFRALAADGRIESLEPHLSSFMAKVNRDALRLLGER